MKTFLFERNFFMIYSGISFSPESMKPFAKFVSIRTGSKITLGLKMTQEYLIKLQECYRTSSFNLPFLQALWKS